MPTVWPTWVQGTMGSTYATNVTVWPTWVQTSGTSGTLPITDPWLNWQTQATQIFAPTNQAWTYWQTSSPIYGTSAAPFAPPASPSARQALISRNRSRARDLRRKLAARRAEVLLLENLSAEQRKDWLADRAFTVHTADGKRAYKIAYGLAGNVRLVKSDEPALGKGGYPLRLGARFCMHVYHPDGPVPNEDNVLAQKLLIESNERGFLDLANVS